MAKLIAQEKGFFGGRVIDIGETFDFPGYHDLAEARRPKWASLFGAANAPANTGVPDDWKTMGAKDRKALAQSVTGVEFTKVAEADVAIQEHLDAAPNASVEDQYPVSSDNGPDPVGNGLQDSLGGTEPDWVAPSAPSLDE